MKRYLCFYCSANTCSFLETKLNCNEIKWAISDSYLRWHLCVFVDRKSTENSFFPAFGTSFSFFLRALICYCKYATFSHNYVLKQSITDGFAWHSAESVCFAFMAYLPNMTPFESLSKYKCLLLFLPNILFVARNNKRRKYISKTVSIKSTIELIFYLVGFKQTNENKNRFYGTVKTFSLKLSCLFVVAVFVVDCWYLLCLCFKSHSIQMETGNIRCVRDRERIQYFQPSNRFFLLFCC